MKGKSSVVDPVPLRMVRPRSSGGESDGRELALVGPTSAFQLPLDWLIEGKPRQNSPSGRIDRYYIEPHTGRKFRSLPEVERYLRGGTIVTHATRRPTHLENKPKIQITTLAIGTSSSSDFVLPDGWEVEGHQRHNSSTIDKYYIEPKTGRKFRSMISVKRHLEEREAGEISTGSPELEVPSVIETQIGTRTTGSPGFVLPEGWIIKKLKRRGRRYSPLVEKCYVDPETGQEFRSLVAVERYLKEKDDHEYSMPLKEFKRPNKRRASLESKSTNESQETRPEISPQKVSDSHPTKSDERAESEENITIPEGVTPDNDSGPSENSDTPMKSEAGEETEAAVDDFGCPPSTINWVLAGPAGDMWNPYLGEFMVPKSTKQKWSETFVSSLNDEK